METDPVEPKRRTTMVPAYQRKPVLAYSVSIAFTFPYLNQTASEFCQVRLLLCQTHLNQPFAHFMAIIYRLGRYARVAARAVALRACL